MKRLFNWLFSKKASTSPTTKSKPAKKLVEYKSVPAGNGRTMKVFTVEPSPFDEPLYKAFMVWKDENGEHNNEVLNPFIGGWLIDDLPALYKSCERMQQESLAAAN